MAQLLSSGSQPDAGTFDIAVANQVFHGAVECVPEVNGELIMTIRVVATKVEVITDAGWGRRPQNKAMKLTRLSAAPGWFREYLAGGAASCPRWHGTAGTASQLIASVRRT